MGARLRESAVVQEGSTPPESPDELFAEVDRLAAELEALIAAINRTNSSTRLPSGATLTEALAHRDVLTLRHGVLHQAAEAAAQAQTLTVDRRSGWFGSSTWRPFVRASTLSRASAGSSTRRFRHTTGRWI